MDSIKSDVPQKISEMCASFYRLGWVSGTGGGISIREGNTIYMAPSGVEKEKIRPEDVFELDIDGNILKSPENPALKLTECAPLFFSAYELHSAGAVIHSHSANVVLATMLSERVNDFMSILQFTKLEMLKGLSGFGYFDTYTLPVVDNTARECDLTDNLRKAMQAYPDSPAVAVADHGIYVWGKDAVQAKTQSECIDYICEIKWKTRQMFGMHSNNGKNPLSSS